MYAKLCDNDLNIEQQFQWGIIFVCVCTSVFIDFEWIRKIFAFFCQRDNFEDKSKHSSIF